jgi:predicted nucleic acid-binding protein
MAFTVVLDACVLYPAPLRDLLMELAVRGLYRSKWSAQIHHEWIRNLLEKRPDLTEERLRQTSKQMDRAVPDSLVEGYQYLLPAVDLPDDDDRHVVAAAIHAKADAIVTANLRDFPLDALTIYNLEAIHPDDFLISQFDLDRAAVVTAAQSIRKRLTRPALDAETYLARLESIGLTKTVDVLRPFRGVL